MLKPFSQDLYHADDNAKHQIIDLFKDYYGLNTWVNPDKYGVDLLGTECGDTFGVEVEVKHEWTDRFSFPFDTVHFAARKVKFFDVLPLVYFVTLNHHRSHALIMSTARFDHCKLVRKQTKYTTTEWFIELPIDVFTQVAL